MTVRDLIIRLSQYAEDCPVMVQIDGEAYDVQNVDIDRVDGDVDDMAVLLGIE